MSNINGVFAIIGRHAVRRTMNEGLKAKEEDVRYHDPRMQIVKSDVIVCLVLRHLIPKTAVLPSPNPAKFMPVSGFAR
jgi:hypothetical protein